MIGGKLKRIRTKRNLTQQQLSEKSGVSYVQIGRYENNINSPSSKVLNKLADALNVSIEHFMESQYFGEFEIEKLDDQFKELRSFLVDDIGGRHAVKTLFTALIIKYKTESIFKGLNESRISNQRRK